MPGSAMNTSRKPYLKIIGGQIVQPAKKDEAGAVLREYELSNGTKGSKWEVPFLNWLGIIEGITFKDGEYGETCNIELDDAILQLSVGGKYFKDIACKLPNADLTKPLLFHPYDMEIDGKKRTGVSLQQGGVKLQNYYYNPETKENLFGFPEVDQEKADRKKKTYWKLYFVEVDEFLVDKLKELKFVPPVKSAQADEAERVFGPDGEEMIDANDIKTPEDLPF